MLTHNFLTKRGLCNCIKRGLRIETTFTLQSGKIQVKLEQSIWINLQESLTKRKRVGDNPQKTSALSTYIFLHVFTFFIKSIGWILLHRICNTRSNYF